MVSHRLRDSSPECLADGKNINRRQPVAVLANRGAAFGAKPAVVLLRSQTMMANWNRLRVFERPANINSPGVRRERRVPQPYPDAVKNRCSKSYHYECLDLHNLDWTGSL